MDRSPSARAPGDDDAKSVASTATHAPSNDEEVFSVCTSGVAEKEGSFLAATF